MDQLRAWFPSYAADLERVRRFWRGEGRCLVSLYPTGHAYRQCFDDEEILSQAPLHIQAHAALPGLKLPSLYPDWGTVTTATYWGGVPRFDSTGGNIFVDPVALTLDAALALEPRPIDDPALDGAHALRLFRELSTRLGTDALWLRSPDMQGTLNTAGLVLHQETMMMAMYGDRAKLHAFLDRVSDFLIAYQRYLRAGTAGRICGNIWPYSFLPAELGVSLTEDLMPLLSAKLYAEFGIPYLKKIGEALGGLHVHCCGDWGRHAPRLKAAGLALRAAEFHYPFTTIEELACLADETVFIPYIMLDRQARFRSTAEYYRYLLEATPHRYWFACAEDTPALRAFAEEAMAAV